MLELQLFCQALDVRPAKRGRVHTGLNFGKWSIRSTAPGVITIAMPCSFKVSG
jgi:hypothetical protein